MLYDVADADMDSLGAKLGSGIGGFLGFMAKGMVAPAIFGGQALTRAASEGIILASEEAATTQIVEKMAGNVAKQEIKAAEAAAVKGAEGKLIAGAEEKTAEAVGRSVAKQAGEQALTRGVERQVVEKAPSRVAAQAAENEAKRKAAREVYKDGVVNDDAIKASAGNITSMSQEQFIDSVKRNSVEHYAAMKGAKGKTLSEGQIARIEREAEQAANEVYTKAKMSTLDKAGKKAFRQELKTNIKGMEKFVPTVFKTKGVGRAGKAVTRMIALESTSNTIAAAAERGDSNLEIISRAALAYGGAN